MSALPATAAAAGREPARGIVTARAAAYGGGVLLAVWLVRPAGVLLVAPLLLWLAQFAFFGGAVLRREPKRVRALASVMLGCAAAAASLPSFVFGVREHPDLVALVTSWHVPPPAGCSAMVVAGFPLPGVRGHGGGGWRDLWLGLGDLSAHAANVALLSAACWALLAWAPLRARLVAYWLGFAVVLPASLYGVGRMIPYWD